MTLAQAEKLIREIWEAYGPPDAELDPDTSLAAASWLKHAFDKRWLVPAYDNDHRVRITEAGVEAIMSLLGDADQLP